MLNAEDGDMEISLLKQERLNRHWSRAQVEVMTRIPQRSLENWEEGTAWPRPDNIEALCRLYGKTTKDLGLIRTKNYDMIGTGNNNTPNSQEENPIMSDLVRRSALSDLGSYLTGLVSTWPRRNHHYGELQEGINRAIIDHSTLIGQDASSAISRRQALMSLGLVPIQLIGGVATRPKSKTADTDTLLTHCAAGITACWYLRRGRDLVFVSDLISSYIAILQPFIYSHSEVYRKASATLLAQSFRLKGSIIEHLRGNGQIAINEAIRYALMAENITEQTITNRMMAFSYWRQGTQGYEQALPYAETAYGLAKSDKSTHRNIQSFAASGFSVCQAVNGKVEDAKISLTEARNLFDPTMSVPFMYYAESNLLAISADIYRHGGHWQESVDLLAKSLVVSDVSALGGIQGRIQYAKIEVSRDDKPRDIDLCITLLTEAITGANELGSKHYIREAREAYSLLRIAWPREQAIKNLGRNHFGVQK